jgi:hypothetical protein
MVAKTGLNDMKCTAKEIKISGKKITKITDITRLKINTANHKFQ